MSSGEDDFMDEDMSGDEGFDLEEDNEFEIDGEDGEDGDDEVDGEDDDIIENTYYEAKGEEDPRESIELFQSVLDMCGDDNTKFAFKALKQIIKRYCQLKDTDKLVTKFKELLKYGANVSRNDYENAIHKVLNLVSVGSDPNLINQIYTIALSSLRKSGNEKLWFNTKLQQGRSLTEAMAWDTLSPVVVDLQKWCSLPNGKEDPKKSSNLLDVLVLEIQMYTHRNELKKLKDLYHKCRQIEIKDGAVVSNPTITGIIRECGGKMNMREKQWAKAYADFFDAFKSYDEAGNQKRISCLKYLVLVAMLRSTEEDEVINPLESSPEAKPYKKHPEIQAMTTMIKSYESNDITTFDNTLRMNKKEIEGDSLMKVYIADLRKSIRMKVLLNLIKPYKRIRLGYLAKQIKISSDVVENLCADLILDDRLKANIDQMNGLLNLESINRNITAKKRYDALDTWRASLSTIHRTILNKID